MRKLTVILAAMILFTGIATSASAQEKKETKKEKKVKIKMINNDDGKITKVDTVIVLKEGESIKDVLQMYNIEMKDSEKDGFYTMELNVVGDGDKNISKTVIVRIDDDGKHKVKGMKAHKMVFISDDQNTQDVVVELDEDFGQSYSFVTSDGDSIQKVMVMSGGNHWIDGGKGDVMLISSGTHSVGHKPIIYEGAKPGDTVRVKTIVTINGQETNVNEEEIIVGEENLHKQYKKMMIIHEDGKQKSKTKKIIVTSSNDMQWNDSDEQVFVFKEDGKSSKVKINIDDAGKEDLKKLKLPKSAKELKVENLFIMFTGGDKMKLSFGIDHKAKTTVRIYDENGKKLFEELKSDFSGKYSNEIPKMEGKMILQVSQGKKYYHKKLEIEY